MRKLQHITKYNYPRSKGYSVRMGWFDLDGRNHPSTNRFFSKEQRANYLKLGI